MGLFAATLAFALLLLITFWGVLLSNWIEAQQNLLVIIGIILTALFFSACLGLGAIVYTIWAERPVPKLEKYIRVAIEMLFPIIIKIGNIFNLSKEKIQDSFIAVNNQLVKTKRLYLAPEQIMVLLPHCLQKANCPRKITMDFHNCQQCGSCPIGSLISLAQKYKTNLAIVTGGTAARKRLAEIKPKAIVAIACERDLVSGIQDAYPLPVLGILNERPQGPCHNTLVDINKVEKSIQYLLRKNS